MPGKSHGRRSLVGCSPWGREKSDTTERLHFHALEKEMATHSSVLAWRIPGTGEPGGLPSLESHRVGHDWSNLAAAAAAAAATLLTQKHVDWTSFPQSAFPGPSDHFISAWGIKVINLVCRIVDFQGTCNPCCYCAFLARPPFQVLQDTADRSTLGSELEL